MPLDSLLQAVLKCFSMRFPRWIGIAIVLLVLFVAVVCIKPELRAFFFQPGKWPQERAKVTLRIIANLQKNYFESQGRYAADFKELNWHLPFDGVYNYYLNDNSIFADMKVSLSINAVEDRPIFYAVAAGNRDDDETLDMWLIDNSGRLVHLMDDQTD
ncbi:MAG: hypothetical protein A3I75_04000 [Deltaproteobacteria bacterium RIFCSPLOWO2_02_FULL_50_16]|nr:MAG: hypothetical protein A3B79_02945 [Deltaproteobacteria bacterium RIFCSPHIGHO2_02_FULL_50_15]OGQ55724.1 MAG: hypothetical protein A3I75_04000 [Deltaproteobacteria bacterium RIFCSPLOWO2_02_FULL_50_16]OGQ65451.1 MAG: hypothetical protein A3F89_06550 [Deltaproteobacteria bacterium RIFCSPLOWO2_12_FULL_50_11]